VRRALPAESAENDRWLIAGLGNPGPGFAGNRHNVGFMCADEIAARMGANFKRDRSRAMALNGVLAGWPVTICKPITFMNMSGGPVSALSRFLKVPPARIVVIHDELDLPFETIRMKLGGGDNGHNGLRSVTSALGTREYYRIRIGIGRPPGRMDPADYVLRDFAAGERTELPGLLDRSADAVDALLTQGLAEAQNAFH
jgi:PTH1 family peptidyl-tRNA hydrolase